MTAYVYILTNKTNEVLYIGATVDLVRRVYEHRNKLYPGSFTARYRVWKLVYYEEYSEVVDAFSREKYFKHMERWEKEDLINKFNPNWKDLFPGLTK